jgi:hypothetical protein
MHTSTANLSELTHFHLTMPRRRPQSEKTEIFWLVLPYFRGMDYAEVRRAISCSLDKWQSTLKQLLKSKVEQRISFRNARGNLEKCFNGG